MANHRNKATIFQPGTPDSQVLVDANGCWIWQGWISENGYGQVWFANRVRIAHRVAYELSIGKPPAFFSRKIFICHHCDVRACVNPAHLFVGDALLNQRDRKNKDRHAAGNRNGRAKLTIYQVREIRRQYDAGEKRVAIARLFGVKKDQVILIGTRRAWKGIE